MNRRRFIASAAAAGLVMQGNPLMQHIYAEVRTGEDRRNSPLESKGLSIRDGMALLKQGRKKNTAPVLRDEILENPDAVFIIRAEINARKNESGQWEPCYDQMERFGRRVANLVFRKGDSNGGQTFIHPNMVGGLSGKNPVTNTQGGIVSPYFTSGMTDTLRFMGNSNVAVGVRGGLRHPHVVESGLEDLFNEHELPLIEAHTQYFEDYHRSELVWHDCPDSVVQKRFCTYKPVYLKDTTYINIAHAHTHIVGLTTLSIKNNQGIIPRGYGHTCDDWTSLPIWRRKLMDDFNRGYRPEIEKLWLKHGNMGYKYWDHGGYYKQFKAAGGYDAFTGAFKTYEKSRGEERKKNLERLYEIADYHLFLIEIWAQRMMDQVSALEPPYVSMVEGVFGRGSDCGIVHSDFLTVSRSMTALDSVTSWLMGHDPRELPYLRIANERGLGTNDIERIPIFTLDENGVERVKDYRTLERTPMGVQVYGLKDMGHQYF